MLMAVNVDKQPMLPTIGEVVNNMFHNPVDAFFTGKAMDILFNGIPIDCSSDHKITAAVCLSFEENASMRKVDDKTYAFSLFAGVSWKSCNFNEIQTLFAERSRDLIAKYRLI